MHVNDYFVEQRNPVGIQRLIKSWWKLSRADFCPNDPCRWLPSVNWFQHNNISTSYALSHLKPLSLSYKPDRPQRVLDVGSGSGYLCVAFAELLAPSGESVRDWTHTAACEFGPSETRKKSNADLLDGYRILFHLWGRKERIPSRCSVRYNPCRSIFIRRSWNN